MDDTIQLAHGAGGRILEDADAGEVGVLVAHAFGAAPSGHFLALHELVSHPVVLFRYEAGSVGNTPPEYDTMRLIRAEGDHHVR